MKKIILTILAVIYLLGFSIPAYSATSCLVGQQGGTGLCTGIAGNVGQVIEVQSVNPLIYTFANGGGGGGGTPGGLTGDFQYNAGGGNFGGTTTPFFLKFNFGTATGTSATTTNFNISNSLTGAGLTTCNSANQALTYSGSLFGCQSIAGSSFPFTPQTGYVSTTTALGLFNGFFSNASSTINANFVVNGNSTTTNATTTTSFTTTASSTSLFTSNFAADGSTLYVDPVNHRVGIGTTTPGTIANFGTGSLDVASAGNTSIILHTTDPTTGTRLEMTNNLGSIVSLGEFNDVSSGAANNSLLTIPNSYNLTAIGAGGLIWVENSPAPMYFATGGGAYGNTRLGIAANGNIAIGQGTTTANFLLEVNGEASTTRFDTSYSTTTNATTTNFFATTASTTNLFGSGLSTCNTAGSSALTYTASSGQFGCNTITGGSGSAFPFTPGTGYVSTTTTLGLFNGFFSNASSTINGNLLVNGNSTTTSATTTNETTTNASSTNEWISSLGNPAGTFIAADPTGRLIATTTPSGGGGSVTGTTGQNVYVNPTNTLAATSTIFESTNSYVGISTTTPWSPLSIATTTFISASKPIGLNIGPNLLVSGSANGTLFGANTAAGYTGNLIDLQQGGVDDFKVASSGNITAQGTISAVVIGGSPFFTVDGAATVTGGTFNTNVININNNDYIEFQHGSGTLLDSTSDGVLLISNGAQNALLMQFGNQTSTAPALKKNGAGLQFRLADDSGFASTTALMFGAGTTTDYALISAQATTSRSTLNLLDLATTTGASIYTVGANGEQIFGGGTPTISSCGTTPNGSVVGNDETGTITVGGGVVTACTLTYYTAKTSTPNPQIEVQGATAIASSISANSKTSFTVTLAATLGGGTFTYYVPSNR